MELGEKRTETLGGIMDEMSEKTQEGNPIGIWKKFQKKFWGKLGISKTRNPSGTLPILKISP